MSYRRVWVCARSVHAVIRLGSSFFHRGVPILRRVPRAVRPIHKNKRALMGVRRKKIDKRVRWYKNKQFPIKERYDRSWGSDL